MFPHRCVNFWRTVCLQSTTAKKIPNNVNLAEDRTLQRALEQWQPNFINWWGRLKMHVA